MVKFVPHDDPTAIRGNRTTADEQNRAMVRKLQKDKGNLKRVKQEMEKLMKQGFIKSLKDLPQETQKRSNSGPKRFILTSIAYKETSASTKVRICWDLSRQSKEYKTLNSFLLKEAQSIQSARSS